MAPERKNPSAKGKARIYNCVPCGTRHAPPTGVSCKLQPRRPTRPSASRSATTTRSATTHVAPATRRLGRPPRTLAPVLSESEDEDLEVLLHQARVQSKRQREEQEDTSAPPGKRPVPTPRVSVRQSHSSNNGQRDSVNDSLIRPGQSTPLNVAPRPTVRTLDLSQDMFVHEPEGEDQPNTTETLVNAVLTQMSALQESSKAERLQMAANQERDRQMFITSIATMSAKVDAIAANQQLNQQQQTGVALASTPIPPTRVIGVRTSTPVQPSTSHASRDNPFPQGQPTPTGTNTQQLQMEANPVKSLRRNESSSNMADQLLKVVGILEEGSQGKAGSHKSSNRKKLAKWPSDYVFRWDDDEPSYDSLSVSEFMARYLSIIEEPLPVNPDNTPAIKHIHYARHLMEDCPHLGWPATRSAHKQVMLAIDYKRLTWADMEGVYKTKADALTRVNHRQPDKSQVTNIPCKAYQNLTCQHEDDHIADGITLYHCCLHCFAIGKRHVHPLANCIKMKKGKDVNKTKKPKTGKTE